MSSSASDFVPPTGPWLFACPAKLAKTMQAAVMKWRLIPASRPFSTGISDGKLPSAESQWLEIFFTGAGTTQSAACLQHFAFEIYAFAAFRADHSWPLEPW